MSEPTAPAGGPPAPPGERIVITQLVATALPPLWEAWQNAGKRHLWLHAPGVTLRRATAHKSLRLIWNDGSNVAVTLAGAAGGRQSVTVTHDRIATAARAAELTAFWGEALARLKKRLERSARR